MKRKPQRLYRQAAALPFRWRQGSLEVMLVTRRNGAGWTFPKGVIEGKLTPELTAKKEAWEEAGVLGDIGGPAISRYEYPKWGGVAQVTIFPLKVTTVLETWDEMDERARTWLPIHSAGSLLATKGQQEALTAFVARAVGEVHSQGPGRSTSVVALDLEGTLISNALHLQPRPHCRSFLDYCERTFPRVCLFTSVPSRRLPEILRLLLEEEHISPGLAERLEIIDWSGPFKDLNFIPVCHWDEVLLVDDQSSYVLPEHTRRWVRIEPFEPPYPEHDRDLLRVIEVLESRKGGTSA